MCSAALDEFHSEHYNYLMADIHTLDAAIRRIPDFPKPGINFYDITGISMNPDAFRFAIDKMVEIYKDEHIDGVVGIESRGFIFAAPYADRVGIPFVLIRKKGKLPGETVSCAYALEYGTAEIEVQKSDIEKGKRYLLVDDLIATGGTLTATRSVIEQCGGIVAGYFAIVGLPNLNYAKILEPIPVKTLLEFEGA